MPIKALFAEGVEPHTNPPPPFDTNDCVSLSASTRVRIGHTVVDYT